MVDTLQLAKTLEKDFTPAQAEALVHALTRQVVDELATRHDIADLRRDIADQGLAFKRDLADLHRDTKHDLEEAKEDVRADIKDAESRLRSEIRDVKIEMIKWIAGAIGLNFIATAGLMITLIKTIH